MPSEIPTTATLRYEIRSVQDFMLVPEYRRALCLREFEIWIGMMEDIKKLMADVPVRLPDAYVWIDDGKHQATIRFSGSAEKS